MKELPDNWETMSHKEKEKFFAQNYYHYIREGEVDGLQPFAPENIKDAYNAFLKEQ